MLTARGALTPRTCTSTLLLAVEIGLQSKVRELYDVKSRELIFHLRQTRTHL